MAERGVVLKLLESDWLTLTVLTEALNQVDDEQQSIYSIDFTFTVMIQSFITAVRDLDNEDLGEYLEYYANLFYESEKKKVTRTIVLPDSQFKWLNGRCNRLNEDLVEEHLPYFTLDVMATAAVYEFRNKYFRDQSEELSSRLNEHLKKPKSKLASKREFVPFTLFNHDIEVLRFLAECASYFYGRQLMYYDVLSMAIENWLKRYGHKDSLKLYNGLEEIGLRFGRFRGYKVWKWSHDLDKSKVKCIIRKDVYHGICHVLSEIESLDQCAVTMNLSVIATDAIRELKKDFLLNGTVETMKIVNNKRGFCPFR